MRVSDVLAASRSRELELPDLLCVRCVHMRTCVQTCVHLSDLILHMWTVAHVRRFSFSVGGWNCGIQPVDESSVSSVPDQLALRFSVFIPAGGVNTGEQTGVVRRVCVVPATTPPCMKLPLAHCVCV
jgi:hypothetical protein